jgi:hypothetical protein
MEKRIETKAIVLHALRADPRMMQLVASLKLRATPVVECDWRRVASALKPFGPDAMPILCTNCPNGGAVGAARAFFAETGADRRTSCITVCANRLHTAADVREALTHELVHAYDWHQRGAQSLATCEGLACSEVRSHREAECAKYARLPLGASFAINTCVKRKATSATQVRRARYRAAVPPAPDASPPLTPSQSLVARTPRRTCFPAPRAQGASRASLRAACAISRRSRRRAKRPRRETDAAVRLLRAS